MVRAAAAPTKPLSLARMPCSGPSTTSLLATPCLLLSISLPFNADLLPALAPLALFRLACPLRSDSLVDEVIDPIVFHSITP
jgi:hypothetical protein